MSSTFYRVQEWRPVKDPPIFGFAKVMGIRAENADGSLAESGVHHSGGFTVEAVELRVYELSRLYTSPDSADCRSTLCDYRKTGLVEDELTAFRIIEKSDRALRSHGQHYQLRPQLKRLLTPSAVRQFFVQVNAAVSGSGRRISRNGTLNLGLVEYQFGTAISRKYPEEKG
ncbi:unnamed protein product [Cyclocybe aegerita]|uniref:Uncharacterized protein n=1 Tax=Cyclocybe aegerita TaxID=1973307 RepID=A0A8S0X2R8_CYCAE|nr:unnamed protein product [Cyclocybe aegerita]